MHLVIISCTPRVQKNSNTDKILSKFKEGFESDGNSTETHYLVNKKTWDEIRTAFYRNDNILFGVPLFVECIPGIMLEFLETLEPKTYSANANKTKLSFLLQGGFQEASQLRCGEKYLEMLPAYLNCEYNGTLIKGNMFGVSFVPEKMREGMIIPFVEMGRIFARDERFNKDKVSEFAKPEYLSKGSMIFFTLLRPLQSMVFKGIAKTLGCKKPLTDKPYNEYISKH